MINRLSMPDKTLLTRLFPLLSKGACILRIQCSNCDIIYGSRWILHRSCILIYLSPSSANIQCNLVLSYLGFFSLVIFLSYSTILPPSSTTCRHNPWLFCGYFVSVCSNQPESLVHELFFIIFALPRYSRPLSVVVWLWWGFSLRIIVASALPLVRVHVFPSIARVLSLTMVLCLSPTADESLSKISLLQRIFGSESGFAFFWVVMDRRWGYWYCLLLPCSAPRVFGGPSILAFPLVVLSDLEMALSQTVLRWGGVVGYEDHQWYCQ